MLVLKIIDDYIIHIRNSYKRNKKDRKRYIVKNGGENLMMTN